MKNLWAYDKTTADTNSTCEPKREYGIEYKNPCSSHQAQEDMWFVSTRKPKKDQPSLNN